MRRSTLRTKWFRRAAVAEACARPKPRGIESLESRVLFAASATPLAPDLDSAFDSGNSLDNITNRDNSSLFKNLEFAVSGTVAGAAVTVYADGVGIGSATANGYKTVVQTDGTWDLSDGVHAITARQLEPGKEVSLNSAVLNIDIDSVAPTVDIINIAPDPRTSAVNAVTIKFSRAVTGMYASYLSLTRDGEVLPLVRVSLTTTDNITFTASDLTTLTDTAGSYALSLRTYGINDARADNPVANEPTDTWVNNGTVVGASPAPNRPDLITSFDTGVWTGDDRTNRDNSSTGKNLQFSVHGTVEGAAVTVFADGVAIGSAVGQLWSTTVTTNGTFDLADGVRSITARQTEPGQTQSPHSVGLNVTVDTVAPTVDVIDVSPDPRGTPVSSVDVQFNEEVYRFTADAMSLTRDGGGELMSAAERVDNTGTNRFTVRDLYRATSTPGNYVIRVRGVDSYLKDIAGNPLVTGASDAFRVTDDSTMPVTVRDVADATVRDGTYADSNFGADTELYVKRSGTAGNSRESYLRFDLSSVPSIGSAKLRLFGRLTNANNATVTTTVYSATSWIWDESALSWNYRPAAAAPAGGSLTVGGTTGKWYEVDLTAFLRDEKAAGRNLVTLVLKNLATSDAQVAFASDEAAANRPELVLTPAAQGLIVSTPTLSVIEGGSAAFSVKLATPTASNVVVNVSKAANGDADLGTATTSLTFSEANWNVPQTVSVAAAEDGDAADGSASFTVSSTGLPGKTVVATEADNDTPPPPPPGQTPVTLRAAADAYVRDGSAYAASNYGAAAQLQVKQGAAGYTRHAYLRFDLAALSSVGAAKLRLFGKLDNTSAATAGFAVYDATDTAWGETAITWNNKPAAGTTTRASGTVAGVAGKWYEVDVTSFLKAQKAAGKAAVTLVLKATAASGATILVDSDEAGGSAPQLVVTPDGPPEQAILVSPANLSVPEGGSAAFMVRLAAPITQNVGLNFSTYAGEDLSLDGWNSGLWFTPDNWDVPQALTINAAEDSDAVNGTRRFRFSTSTMETIVIATEADNEPAPGPVSVRAGADAYVRDGTYAPANYGTATQLQVKQGAASYTRESYLRFDLSSVASVSSARLRLFGKLDNTAAASAGFTIYNSSNTTWSETGVTWNAKPVAGTTSRGSGTVSGTTGAWVEVDLTAFLAAEKAAGRNVVTLVLKATAASGSTILFDSDEGANRPELVVS